MAWSNPDKTAGGKALHTLKSAATHTLDILAQDHRAWWNAFYRKSFLSIPDGRLQSFYWIQLYKVASATRRNAPVMATTSPGWSRCRGRPPGGTSTCNWSTG